MTISHSDALVFFGATGDLAYKKIFPALQAMIKRGHLDMPVSVWLKLVGTSNSFGRGHTTASRNTAGLMLRLSPSTAACSATSTATTRMSPRRPARPSTNTIRAPGGRVRSTRQFRLPEAGITRPPRTREISASPQPVDEAGATKDGADWSSYPMCGFSDRSDLEKPHEA